MNSHFPKSKRLEYIYNLLHSGFWFGTNTSDGNSSHLAHGGEELLWLQVINRAAGRVGDKRIESFRIKDTKSCLVNLLS